MAKNAKPISGPGARRRHPIERQDEKKTTLREVVEWLEKRGTDEQVSQLVRYGIVAHRPFGVSVGDLKKYAKQVGADHELALELWATGRYEARMLATMIDEPAKVTVAQMNAWAADFDSWAIVDTACFHLFDRTKHAWKRVPVWARARREFKKRAAFALLWSLSVHDKEATDRSFIEALPIIEKGAEDPRDLVKKAVNMALRAIGKRSATLNRAAVESAERLSRSEDSAPRWVGSHALRELKKPELSRKLRSKKL